MDLSLLLLLVVFFVGMFRRGAAFVAALVYASCSIIHTLLAKDSPDLIYYASAGIADFVALIVLSSLRPVDGVVHGLAWVCVASIGTNIAGLIGWYLYYPPTLYNLAFVVVYLAALVVVVKGASNDMGGRAVRWDFARPVFPSSPRGSRRHSHKEAA